MKRNVLKLMMGIAVCIGCGMYGYTNQVKETKISPLANVPK